MTDIEIELEKEKEKRRKLKNKAIVFAISSSCLMGALGITLGATLSKEKIPSELNEFLQIYEEMQGLFYQEVDNRTIIDGLYYGLTDAFNDDYTFYTSTYQGESQNLSIAGFGLGFSRVVYYGNCLLKHVFKDSPAYKSGLQDGDIIEAVAQGKMVNGNLVFEEKQVLKNIDSASWSSLFQGEKDSFIKCYVTRGEQKLEIKVQRGDYTQDSVYLKEVSKVDGYVEAYVAMPTFLGIDMGEYLSSILDNVENEYGEIDHLIIDLRQNGGGYVSNCIDALGVFLPKGSLALSYVRQGGKIENKYTTRDKQYYIKDNNIDLLIDDNTASAAESFVMGLVDSPCMEGVEVYGKTSYGKGIAQDFIDVEDGTGTIRVTFAKVTSPKNNCIHRIGITPDVECGYVSQYEDIYRKYITGGEEGNYKDNYDLVVQKINACLGTTYSDFNSAVQGYQKAKKLDETSIFDEDTADALQDDLYDIFVKGTNEDYLIDYSLLSSYIPGAKDNDSFTPLQRKMVKKQISKVLDEECATFDIAVNKFQEKYDLSKKSGIFDNETSYYLSGKIYDILLDNEQKVVEETK
ncbi:MAG: S41 family peptidase [Erysipelotrichaceae bacterium]|nr:S41 family peptidase [Erysipelotrichaceae bacterium]